MNSKSQRITVFGATGKCGQATVELARGRGHQVCAAVREGTNVPSTWGQGVRIARCNPYANSGIDEAIQDADAVISCIGIRRRNPMNPWSRLASPADTAQRCTAHLVSAMQSAGVQRLACISAAGVADSRSKVWFPLGLLIACSNIGVAYRDLEAMERVMIESSLTSLAIRPTTLTNNRADHTAVEAPAFRYASRIPRRAVAKALVDFCEHQEQTGGCELRMVTGRAS